MKLNRFLPAFAGALAGALLALSPAALPALHAQNRVAGDRSEHGATIEYRVGPALVSESLRGTKPAASCTGTAWRASGASSLILVVVVVGVSLAMDVTLTPKQVCLAPA